MLSHSSRLTHVPRSLARLFLVMAAAVSLESASAAAPEGRPQLPLAGDWKMALSDKEDAAPKWGGKPFKLPGTMSLPKGKSGLLLEREITVPEAWKGSRVVVHIDHPIFTASVSANGAQTGDILGYGGEVDITPQVKFGASNTVRLFFPHGGGTAIQSDIWASRNLAAFAGNERNTAGVLGMPDTVYIERQNPDVQVIDVWYRTFTRGSTRVEPQITVKAARPLMGVRASVQLYAPGQAQPVAAADLPLASLTQGETTHSLKIPADTLKLWSLREPNLYVGQVILSDASGRELDRSAPVTFGIREFWIQGRDYYLNNHPVNLTLDAYLFTDVKKALDAGVTLSFGKHAEGGVNLIHDNEGQARQFDQIGMGLISYGVGVGYKSPSLTNAENLAGYRVWLQAHMRKMRNHPSILFWVISTNMAGGDTFNPTTIGRSSALRQNDSKSALPYIEHHRADDTRPSFHHQSAGTGDLDAGNIYFNHLPQQSAEDWMSAWKEAGDRPYMFIEYMGNPLIADYVRSNTQSPLVSYATEYAARLAGARAYREETPAYRDYSTYKMPYVGRVWGYDPTGYYPLLLEQLCKVIPETYRTCRYYGVPSDLWVFPFEDKKKAKSDEITIAANARLVGVATDVLKAECFWIGGPANEWTSKAHQFVSGEAIRKSVLCINDQNWENHLTVTWQARLKKGGKVIASGTQTATVGVWGRASVPIEFRAPENASTIPLPIEISATVSGVKGLPQIACEPVQCTVWPAKEVPENAALAVFDPEGETAAWLQKTGVRVVPFQPGMPKPRTLVIGRRALRKAPKLPFTADDVRGGMRVLLCEQACGDLEKFGFRTEDHSPRITFARSAASPILAGLNDDALHDWNGNATMLPWGPDGDTTHVANSRRSYHWSNRGTVVSNLIETPHFGPFKPVVDCEFDLAYSPLFSWRHGAGEILFCQLDVTGRTAYDPAVARLQKNLVAYLQAPLPAQPQSRVALCASEATRQQITALGFAADLWKANADPAKSILVVARNDWALWPQLRGQALAFADNGGDVLIFPAGGALAADPAFKGLAFKPVRADKVELPGTPDRLLDGAGPQNVHWRQPLDLVKIEAQAGSGFQSLLDGFAGRLPRGKGQILFLQIDPGALQDYKAVTEGEARVRNPEDKPLPQVWYTKDRHRTVWQSNRLSALILSNLGVESSPSLVKTIFEGKIAMPFYPVDKWMLLGPIPADASSNPVAADFSALLKERSMEKPVKLPNGASIPWYAPNDFNNGLGVAGMVDLTKPYGLKPRQTALALTYIWSSRDRTATFQFGADQWLKVQVNGKEIFRTESKFAKEFGFTAKGALKTGWNEVVCAVGASNTGHAFWFRVSNPGDTIEAQELAPSKASPMIFLRFVAGGKFGKMSDQEIEAAENAEPGFALYTEPLSTPDDPYLYMRW